MTTFEIANRARERQFWYTPYRTGNLARSVGNVTEYFTESHYVMFNDVREAVYGFALNEEPIIYWSRNVRGKTVGGHYVNKHYKWVDKYVGFEALAIDSELGTVGK